MEGQSHPAALPVAAPEAGAAKPGAGRRGQKRRRRRSNEANAQKKSSDEVGQEEGGGGEKRPRNRQMSISSKAVANHVMKTRLLGSESDPLNLEGVGTAAGEAGGGGGGGGGGGEGEGCSSCALSPVFGDGGQPALPRPPLLKNPRDPLNLEGFLPGRLAAKTGGVRGKRGGRRKTLSLTEEGGVGGTKQEGVRGRGRGGRWGRGGRGRGASRAGRRKKSRRMETEGDTTASSGPASEPPVFKPEDQRYCYGNYDMYYGYRCASRGSVEVGDPRIGLMRREWFEGKDCLDIGSNTGQITLALAQQFGPRSIAGIDIDHKLVRMANKNLFKQQTPTVTPDGRTFPSSFTSTSSFSLLSSKISSQAPRPATTFTAPQPFPHNVSFSQENYVPSSEAEVDAAGPKYDVILALSLTKWVHLNWGDSGLRRMFRKMFRQLRPGGRLVLEPQPFGSYSRRKKLTSSIYKNYQAIKLQPSGFQTYLMSREVGFAEHKFLGVPQHKSAGFRRPLHLFVKSKTGKEGGRVGGGTSGKEGEGGGRVRGGEVGVKIGERKGDTGGEEVMETAGGEGEGGERVGEGGGNLADIKETMRGDGERETRVKESEGVTGDGEEPSKMVEDGRCAGEKRAQRDRTSGQ